MPIPVTGADDHVDDRAPRSWFAGRQQVTLWCRANRHLPVDEQKRSLNLKLPGHYGYYGITGNFRALKGFRNEVLRSWRRWLDRRSQRARMNWTRFLGLLQRYPISPPRVVQSVYAQRTR
jgi:hypothetical protein